MSAKFGRRPFPRSSVILFTEWQEEWQTERSHNLRLLGGGNNNKVWRYVKPFQHRSATWQSDGTAIVNITRRALLCWRVVKTVLHRSNWLRLWHAWREHCDSTEAVQPSRPDTFLARRTPRIAHAWLSFVVRSSRRWSWWIL